MVFGLVGQGCVVGEIISAKPWSRRKGDNVDWSLPPEHDVRAAFVILAEEGGSAKRAVDRIYDEVAKLRVDPRELIRWRDEQFPEVWASVSGDHHQKLEQVAESQARMNAIRAGQAAAVAIDLIEDKLVTENPDLIDSAKALDSLTKAGSASTDQVLKLSGRPVQGGSGGSVTELMRWFQQQGLAVEGSAVEVPADVVADGGS